MSNPNIPSVNLVESEQPSFHAARWTYDCDLHQQHVDARLLPNIHDANAKLSYQTWDGYFQENIVHGDSPLGTLAQWAKNTIHRSPAGVDIARDVDDGGYTKESIEPTMFSRWVPTFDDGTHLRLSESRTAYHNSLMQRGGALRSPAMGGIVMEATNNPESLDPRDAVSLIVLAFERHEDARYPWLRPQNGRLFDFTAFRDKPYTVGPLYSGYPNEIHDPVAKQSVANLVRNLIKVTSE